MGKTVEELLDSISSRELTEWMVFFQLEPFGAEIENWRFGMLAAVMAKLHGHRGSVKPDDFMPKARKIKDPAQQLEILRAFFK